MPPRYTSSKRDSHDTAYQARHGLAFVSAAFSSISRPPLPKLPACCPSPNYANVVPIMFFPVALRTFLVNNHFCDAGLWPKQAVFGSFTVLEVLILATWLLDDQPRVATRFRNKTDTSAHLVKVLFDAIDWLGILAAGWEPGGSWYQLLPLV